MHVLHHWVGDNSSRIQDLKTYNQYNYADDETVTTSKKMNFLFHKYDWDENIYHWTDGQIVTPLCQLHSIYCGVYL